MSCVSNPEPLGNILLHQIEKNDINDINGPNANFQLIDEFLKWLYLFRLWDYQGPFYCYFMVIGKG